MLRWHGWAQLLGQVGSRLTSSAPNEGKMDIQFVHPFWGCYVLLSLQILYFFHMVSGEKLDTVSGGITIKHDVSNYQKGCFLEGTCQLQAVGDLLLQNLHLVWPHATAPICHLTTCIIESDPCRPPCRPPCKMQCQQRHTQGGAPPVISWFIIPITIDITPINPSYSTYKPT